MTFVDVKSKLAVGWALGPTRNTELAKRSLKGLQETLKKLGLDADKGHETLRLHHPHR